MDSFIDEKKREERCDGLQVSIVHIHRVSMPHTSKEEASEVSSHFVVVQEQINHVEQQAEEIPNHQAMRNDKAAFSIDHDNTYDG